jgi:hypothetical protein
MAHSITNKNLWIQNPYKTQMAVMANLALKASNGNKQQAWQWISDVHFNNNSVSTTSKMIQDVVSSKGQPSNSFSGIQELLGSPPTALQEDVETFRKESERIINKKRAKIDPFSDEAINDFLDQFSIELEAIQLFNPFHDKLGRFTSGPKTGATLKRATNIPSVDDFTSAYNDQPRKVKALVKTPSAYAEESKTLGKKVLEIAKKDGPGYAAGFAASSAVYTQTSLLGGAATAAILVSLFGGAPPLAVFIGGVVVGSVASTIAYQIGSHLGNKLATAYLDRDSPKDKNHISFTTKDKGSTKKWLTSQVKYQTKSLGSTFALEGLFAGAQAVTGFPLAPVASSLLKLESDGEDETEEFLGAILPHACAIVAGALDTLRFPDLKMFDGLPGFVKDKKGYVINSESVTEFMIAYKDGNFPKLGVIKFGNAGLEIKDRKLMDVFVNDEKYDVQILKDGIIEIDGETFNVNMDVQPKQLYAITENGVLALSEQELTMLAEWRGEDIEVGDQEDLIKLFNPFHDPNTGRFTSAKGVAKTAKKFAKVAKKGAVKGAVKGAIKGGTKGFLTKDESRLRVLSAQKGAVKGALKGAKQGALKAIATKAFIDVVEAADYGWGTVAVAGATMSVAGKSFNFGAKGESSYAKVGLDLASIGAKLILNEQESDIRLMGSIAIALADGLEQENEGIAFNTRGNKGLDLLGFKEQESLFTITRDKAIDLLAALLAYKEIEDNDGQN